MKLSKSIKTDLLFLLFAILWGASYPITQSAINTCNPYLFVFLRFCMAAIMILPFAVKELKYNISSTIKIGMTLGFLNTAIYLFETLSLQYTSVSKSAFIMGSNVILVPFLAHITRISRITTIEIISAIIFVIGLYILTGSHLDNLNYGDLLAISGAIAIALSITYLQRISSNLSSPMLLTFFQLAFACPIPIMFYFANTSGQFIVSVNTICAIIFCGIFATAIPLLGQIKFQKYTSASQAATIFALEPIFACLFAYVIFKDQITLGIIVGGIIMLFSCSFPTIIKFFTAVARVKESRFQ